MIVKKSLIEKARKADQLRKEVNKGLLELMGESVVIPRGKYKGRLGVIKFPYLDSDGVIRACIPPYNLVSDDLETLNDHVDARTHWSIEGIESTIENVTVKLVREYGRRAKND